MTEKTEIINFLTSLQHTDFPVCPECGEECEQVKVYKRPNTTDEIGVWVEPCYHNFDIKGLDAVLIWNSID